MKKDHARIIPRKFWYYWPSGLGDVVLVSVNRWMDGRMLDDRRWVITIAHLEHFVLLWAKTWKICPCRSRSYQDQSQVFDLECQGNLWFKVKISLLTTSKHFPKHCNMSKYQDNTLKNKKSYTKYSKNRQKKRQKFRYLTLNFKVIKEGRSSLI